jgi:F0F1-type ATP synthase assembly protein I
MKNPSDVTKYMQLLLKIGTVMVLSIGLFFAFGLFLLRRFNFPAWVMILFVFLGVVGGFLNVVRELKRLDDV